MGMKAKVGLLALLVATVAGAIAFDQFRSRTAGTTQQSEPQKSDTPAAPEVAATPTRKESGLTPVKEIVAAPKPKPEPPKPKPEPPKPRPAAPKAEPPKPKPPNPEPFKPEPTTLPLPTDFTKAEPPEPNTIWKPEVSDPAAAAKAAASVPEPSKASPPPSAFEVVNRPEPKAGAPSGLDPSNVIRPPADTTAKAPVPPTPAPPQAPIAPDSYEIAPGDSLYVISQKVYGSPRHWRQIFEANRDKLQAEDHLVAGTRIRIPKIATGPAPNVPEASPSASPMELAGKRTHTVKAGDSLSTISKLYYKDSRYWQKIQEANSKVLPDPHSLKVGLVLVIPEVQPSAVAKAPETAPSAPAAEFGGKKIHVVAAGDNLSTISQKHFGTTRHWKAIFDANRGVLTSPDILSAGMKLVIPEVPATPVQLAGVPSAPKTPSMPAELAALGMPYTVQEGDTLSSIAERFLGSENEWRRIDALNKGITYRDADHLSIGTVIVIPTSAKSPTEEPVVKTKPALEKIPTPPPATTKKPEPPKKDAAGSKGGTRLIGD